jgi:predicted RNase H-like nuclease (RuvC/YqgF family)
MKIDVPNQYAHLQPPEPIPCVHTLQRENNELRCEVQQLRAKIERLEKEVSGYRWERSPGQGAM